MSAPARSWSSSLRLLLALVLLAVGLPVLAPGAAEAIGRPDVEVEVVLPARVRYGAPAEVAVVVRNPTLVTGHHLAVRLVLPDGVRLRDDTTSAGTPTILDDAPALGQTTLLLEGLGEAPPNSERRVTFAVDHDVEPAGSALRPGAVLAVEAGAHVNDLSTARPRFDAVGIPAGGFTGTDTATGRATIAALSVEFDEGSPDGQVLRGLHDEQVVSTITVRNTDQQSTSDTRVDLWLHAGWELLGCGVTDHTVDAATNRGNAEEFTGAGSIAGRTPTPAGCIEPDLVETAFTDPDGGGSLPKNVYTHAAFTQLGTLAPGGVVELPVVLAVPLRGNGLGWTTVVPPKVPADPGLLPPQAANLANNGGVRTVHGTALTAWAQATGVYDGTLDGAVNPVRQSALLRRTAVDVRTTASLDTETLAADVPAVATSTVAVGEYRWVRDTRLSVAVGDGWCPVDVTAIDPRCATAGDPTLVVDGGAPAATPWESETEAADGSFVLVAALPPALAPGSRVTLTQTVAGRARLQEAGADADPVRVGDVVPFVATAVGQSVLRCHAETAAPPCAAGTSVASGEPPTLPPGPVDPAARTAASPVVEATPAAPVITVAIGENPVPSPGAHDCATVTWTTDVVDHRPGDRICVRVAADLTAGATVGDGRLVVVLPPDLTIEATDVVVGPGNTLGPLSPTVGASQVDVVVPDTAAGGRLELLVPLRVSDEPAVGAATLARDHVATVAWTAHDATSGVARAVATERQTEPNLLVDLNVAGDDEVTVRHGDRVTLTLAVTNDGAAAAEDAQVRAVLPDGLACVDVVVLPPGATCVGALLHLDGTAGSTTFGPVAVDATVAVDLEVVVPDGTGTSPAGQAGTTYVLDAGVRELTGGTNTGAGPVRFVPASNIDPVQDPDANVDASDDDAQLALPPATVAIVATSELDEPGNPTAGAAANGEGVEHVLTFRIPAGTAVRDGLVELPLPAGLVVDPGTSTISGPGLIGAVSPDCAADLANGFRFCDVAGADGDVVSIALGPAVVNATASEQTWVVTVPGVVAGDAARGTRLDADAELTWGDGLRRTAAASTVVVVPSPTATKTSDAVGPVTPGREVAFTVTVGNEDVEDTGTWHDVIVTDTVPPELTPLVAPGGVPALDGGVVAGAPGRSVATWDETARTLTWSGLAPIERGTTTVLDYAVEVTPTPIAAVAYVNTVVAEGDGHPASPATEAAATAGASAELEVEAPELVVALDEGRATIGDSRTVTASLTVPAAVQMPATTVTIAVPDGLSVVGFGPGPAGATTSATGPAGDGTWSAVWDLGDVGVAPEVRVLELPVVLRVDDTLVAGRVERGRNLRPTAQLAWEDAAGATLTREGGGVDLLVTEPSLTLDLDLVGQTADTDTRRLDVDADVTFTVSVTNAFLPDVTAAHDLEVVVTVDDGVVVDPASVVDGGTWDPGARTITWGVVGPLVPGASVARGFGGGIADSATFVAADTSPGIGVSATLAHGYGRPQTDPDAPPATDRRYTGLFDEVRAVADLPIVRLEAAGERALTRTGDSFRWAVTATNDALVAVADGLGLALRLPPNWSYDASSMEIRLPGAPGFVAVDPAVVGRDVTLDLDALTTLRPGERVEVAFTATPDGGTAVDPGVGAPSVLAVDLAVLDGDGNPGTSELLHARSATASTLVSEVADLGVRLELDRTTLDLASPRVLATTIVRNEGPNDATNIQVAVELPLGPLSVVGHVAARGSWDPATGIWTVGTVAAGEEVTLVHDLEARRPDAADDDPLLLVAELTNRDQIDDGPLPSRAEASVHVQRADVRTELAVADGPWYRGDTTELIFALVNDGPDPAGNVTLATTVPAGLTVLADRADVGTWDAGVWHLPELESGGRAELVLTVALDAVGARTVVGEVVAQDEADQDSLPGNGVIAEDDQATFNLTVTGASVGDLVWFDANGDGVQDAAEPPMPDVIVEVHEADGSSLFATTDAAGAWGVDGLAGGDVVVRLRSSSLPAGVVQLAGDRTVTLENGDVRRDVDLGVAGRAWVGDDSWYDADGDGARQEGEAPVPGLVVQVTWYGRDGVPGTADDVVFPEATTAASGTWATSRLPEGTFLAQVLSGVPTGMTASHDLDGLVSPGSAVFTIDDAIGRTDLDWGWTGSGAMGDLVWLDVDGDGLATPGEPGIPDVDLRLRWRGQDGIADTPDDTVLPTVRTGPDGTWRRGGLPAGIYDVSVLGGVPDGLDLARDLDAVPDGTTQVALLAAAAREDVDFAYVGTGSLGDRVYLDLDADGADGDGDPGLAGIALRATWAGFDDVVGTVDDVVYDRFTVPGGTWEVTRAPPGTYEVVVGADQRPDGTVFAGDPDGGADGTFLVALAADELRTDADLGLLGGGTLGDLVWFDAEDDGVFDGDEVGVGGAEIGLGWVGPDGTFGTEDDLTLPPTTTDVEGRWTYPNLPAGSFEASLLVSSLPGGMAIAVDPDGGLDGRASMFLGADATVDTMDFGVRGIDVVGDVVWLDLNGDRTRTPDEPGLADVGLVLTWAGQDGTFGTADDTTATTRTLADGSYAFTGLADGPHTIALEREDLPEGAASTTDGDDAADGIARFDLVGGNADIDFGVAGTAEIGDRMWLDLDRDAVDDDDEPGLAGVEVRVTWSGPDGADGTEDDIEWPLQVSGPDGRWHTPHLLRGTYVIQTAGTAIDGLVITYDADDGDADPDGIVEGVFVSRGQVRRDLDFAFVGPRAVGGPVWLDRDGDAVLDPGVEPGLAGAEVEIRWSGGDGVLATPDDLVLRTASDADGRWYRDGLPEGIHEVTLVEDSVPAGLVLGGPATYSVVLADEDDLDLGYGLRGTAGVGGRVAVDLDADGVADPDEPGVLGAEVRVTWAGGDEVVGTADDVVVATMTAADGGWSVDGTPAGNYRLLLRADSVPEGLSAVQSAQEVLLVDGEVRDDVDFPLQGSAGMAGRTYLDRDQDGVLGADDPPLGDVEIRLVGAGPDDVFGTGDDNVMPPRRTAVDGTWSAEALPSGRWRLQVLGAPAALDLFVDPDSAPGSADGTAEVVLVPGEVREGLDVGWAGDGVLGGTVRLNPVGSGVPDVVVTLTWTGLDGLLDTADDRLLRTTTAADGTWRFRGLVGGDHVLTVLPPAGMRIARAPEPTILLAPHGRQLDLDTELVGIHDAAGSVWLDVDGDGIRSASDPGVPGVDLDLTWLGPDDLADTPDDVPFGLATTGPEGLWTRDELPAGSLLVRFDTLPAGLVAAIPTDGRVVAPIGDGLDLGVRGTARVSGRAFWMTGSGTDAALPAARGRSADAAADATIDVALADGVLGVTIAATWAGLDGTLDTSDDVTLPGRTTGVAGAHGYAHLPAGPLRLDVGVPTGWELQGSDPRTVEVAAGAARDDVHLPLVGLGRVRGTVVDDLDGDGTQDPGDRPLGDVTVALTQAGADGFLDTTDDVAMSVISGADGAFAVSGLPPGPVHVTTSGLEAGRTATVPLPLVADTLDDEQLLLPLRATADLSLAKTALDRFGVGASARWSLAVSNNGPAAASGVEIVDPLPDGLTFDGEAGPGWTCGEQPTSPAAGALLTIGGDHPSDALVCRLDGLLAVGQSVSLTLSVQVGAAAFPSVTNRAAVVSDVPDPDPSDNVASATAPVLPLANLVLDKSLRGELVEGGEAVYALEVVNRGPNVDAGPLVLTDVLPRSLELQAWGGIDWVCAAEDTGAGGAVTCTYDEVLAPGETTVVLLTVAVLAEAGTLVTNEASVLGGAVNPSPEDAISVLADIEVQPAAVSPPALARTGAGIGWLVLAMLVLVVAGSGVLRLAAEELERA